MPVGIEAASQRLIPTGEQSGLLTRIATTESVSLCTRMKSRRLRVKIKKQLIAPGQGLTASPD
jgi:hypothetical protein